MLLQRRKTREDPLPARPVARAGTTSLRAGGFSFIEVVFALVILTILMSALFYSHAELIRARDRVRRMEESRLLAMRIAGRFWLGDSPAIASAKEKSEWKIECSQVNTTDSTNNAAWECWAISPANNANDRIELFLRQREDSSVQKSP